MKRVWTPAPLAVSASSLFTAEEITAYEQEILENPHATETDASRFFLHHPRFLHLGTGAEVRREVVLSTESGSPRLRVDFFRRSYGKPFWDLIELKSPQVPVVVTPEGLHPRLTAEIDKAINQALDYRDLIDRDGVVRRRLAANGIAVCRPQIIVVAGHRQEEVPPELLQILYDRIRQRGPIETWSYTDIYDFAKEHYARNQVVVVPAMHFSDSEVINQAIAWERRVEELAADPDALRSLSPRAFEELVAQILQGFGYDVELLPSRSDAGFDLVAVQTTPVAQTRYVVECKHRKTNQKIGVDEVRRLMWVVQNQGATGGILATTSTFTKAAEELLAKQRWVVAGKNYSALQEWIARFEQLKRGRDEDLL